MRVRTPNGDEWKVRRRVWIWRKPKWRGRDMDLDGLDWVDGGDDVLGFIGLIVLVIVALFLFIPLAVFVVELLVVLVLTAAAAFARAAFGGAWLVEAVGPRKQRRTWKVRGRDASAAKVTAVAEAIAAGRPMPR